MRMQSERVGLFRHFSLSLFYLFSFFSPCLRLNRLKYCYKRPLLFSKQPINQDTEGCFRAGYQTRDLWLLVYLTGWLFSLIGPLRQYFSLYRAVSQREGERKMIDERKNVKKNTAPTASAIDSCPSIIKISRKPGTGILPSTVAPPDHSRSGP